MEQDSIERIRSATFSVGRRGYEKREVDTFLARIADWLEAGGGDVARSETIKRELERIGERTGKILGAAEEAAEAIRGDAQAEATDLMEEARTRAEAIRVSADKYAKETRDDADAYAEKLRSEADAYSQPTRDEADSYAETTRAEAESYAADARETAEIKAAEMIEDAKRRAGETLAEAMAKAKGLVEEGTRRRRETETVISDLEKRRDGVLAGIEQLTTQLAGAATQHRPEKGDDTPTRKMSTAPPVAEPEEPASAP